MKRLARRTIPGFAVLLILAAPTTAGEWYRGDLHNHSLHSDGDSPVAEVLASAASRGLDFFALTDHDSRMDGEQRHWADPNHASDELVLLYGAEWTTSLGHANVWSTEPFEYADLWQANRDLAAAAAVAAAHAQGALFSINHPVRNRWQFPVVSGVDCIEIWNGPMLVNANFRATHDFWDGTLLAGRRITGVGGSDTHQLHGWQTPFTAHGNPTTWVYAEELTAAAILDGVRNGRITISYTVDATRLELEADTTADGTYESRIGDGLTPTGDAVAFRIRLTGGQTGPGDAVEFPDWIVAHLNDGQITVWDYLWTVIVVGRLETTDNMQFVNVIKNGDMHRAWLISGGTDTLEFEDIPDAAGRTFYRAEMYGDTGFVSFIVRLVYGSRTALTNPIYFNYGPREADAATAPVR